MRKECKLAAILGRAIGEQSVTKQSGSSKLEIRKKDAEMTKVAGKIQINAAKKKVWQVLAELGSVSAWNPAIGNSYYTSEQKEGRGNGTVDDL